MATVHSKKIIDMTGEAGTSNSLYIFEDGSTLVFSLSPNPNPRAIGGENSDAHRFARDVASFTTMDGGYEFVFKDNSKFAIDLGNAATTTYPDAAPPSTTGEPESPKHKKRRRR